MPGKPLQRHDQLMLESLYWWDIPTFFRCPIERDPDNCDIALIGIPHSTGNGTTERDQHLAPRAIRDVSAMARRVHMAFGIDPWVRARIRDMGDVPLPEANDNEASIARITDFFRDIDAAGTRPVSVGGDHSITGAVVQAIAGRGARLTGGKPVALLHFDAHTDAYEHVPHFLGAHRSAAHWASYLVHNDHVDPHRSVQIGMRGNPRSLDWRKPSEELGYTVVPMEQYSEMGVNRAIDLMDAKIGDSPLYVTFDLDCFDPTIAPGVANIEAGCEGFRVDEVMRMLRSVRGKRVIGGDLVCMMPTKDHPNRITAHTGAAILFELVSLLADQFGDDHRPAA